MKKKRNIMKVKLLLFLISILLLSCNKTENEPNIIYPDFIRAGETFSTPSRKILYTEIENTPHLYDNYQDVPIDREYALDINNDGIDDFSFKRSRSFSSEYDSLQTVLIPLNNNELMAPSYNSNLVDTIGILDTIGFQSNWVNKPCIIYNYYQNQSDSVKIGLWKALKFNYIGVRMPLDEYYLHGWIRIDVKDLVFGFDVLVIYDYACTVGQVE